jgi:hypothetical protein
MEAEFVAASDVLCERIFAKKLAIDYCLSEPNDQILLLYDNKAAIQAIDHPSSHSKAKHIGIRYNFVRVEVKRGLAKIEHFKSSENLADPLTKSLPKTFLYKIIGRWGIGPMGRVVDTGDTPRLGIFSVSGGNYARAITQVRQITLAI